MEKNSCWLLMLMLSISLGHALTDLSKNTEINKPAGDSLAELGYQEKMLNARTAEMITKASDAQCTSCCNKCIYPRNCAEATAIKRTSGIYTIQLDLFDEKAFLVSCDESEGGAWTVIQRRQNGSIDFYRNWADYKIGFGDLNGDFFIGLDKLHALTMDREQELYIMMKDFNGITKYAKYDSFAIGDESEAYVLKVLGIYAGDAGDSMWPHRGRKFTTRDRKNDNLANNGNCAQIFRGAWWYSACHLSNLNGLYLKGEYGEENYGRGIVWDSWHGMYYSLKFVQMMIRPKRN